MGRASSPGADPPIQSMSPAVTAGLAEGENPEATTGRDARIQPRIRVEAGFGRAAPE